MLELHVFDVAAILVVLAAVFGLLNHHVLRLPFTIGLTVSGLAASLVLVVVAAVFPNLGIKVAVAAFVTQQVDFHGSLMHGMLSFLLFAGALHVDLRSLWKHKTPILSLATIGTVVSTAVIGVGAWGVFGLAGVDVSLSWCLVFGALISPTDPIAVLGIMKSAQAPRSLETKIAGESLFNDGVGVVVFTLLLAHAIGGEHAGESHGVGEVFLVEVVGGLALGLAAGWLTYMAMRSMEEANLEILLSVALVMGVTFVAFQLHTSAPLACVAAGLLIGNRGRKMAMGAEVRQALDVVWSFLDETFNAVLFLLVGLEVLALEYQGRYLFAAALLIPLALVSRLIAVSGPIFLLRFQRSFAPGTIRILTWGGLRGGISVALALSLPPDVVPAEVREAILFATYAIVVFSLLVQGLTIGKLIRKFTAEPEAEA